MLKALRALALLGGSLIGSVAMDAGPQSGAELYLSTCNASSPSQRFVLKSGTVQTLSAPLCVTYNGGDNVPLVLLPCDGSALQSWSFSTVTGTFTGVNGDNQCRVWNTQGGPGSEGVGSSVSVWADCGSPAPGFNEVFRVDYPAPSLISEPASSPDNSTFANLCVDARDPVPPAQGTPEQIRWQGQGSGAGDVAVFIHYNIATAAGTQGCGGCGGAPPNISIWNPSALDTDSWISSGMAMGATRFIYVAKHGCGFAAWKSAPSYPYSASHSSAPNADVVGAFVASAKKFGVGFGFYYSVVSNQLCNVCNGVVNPNPSHGQLNVTQAEYDAIVLTQLRELWTNYGPLDELWFDGGYGASLKTNLSALIAELQPHAVAFGGDGLLPSAARWVGTEDGFAPYPCWSSDSKPSTNGAGDPNGAQFIPAETDFTLQNGDNWFYNAAAGVHTPGQLRDMFETSTGHNSPVIIDFAPFPNGSLPLAQVTAARTLGAFLTGCYSAPIANGSASGPAASPLTLRIATPGGATIDRVRIIEDMTSTRMQLVRAFTLIANTADGGSVSLLSNGGSSIGAKFIVVLSKPLSGVVSVTLNVTRVATGAPPGGPFISSMAVFSCNALARTLDDAWPSEYSAAVDADAPAAADASTSTWKRTATRPWSA